MPADKKNENYFLIMIDKFQDLTKQMKRQEKMIKDLKTELWQKIEQLEWYKEKENPVKMVI